MLVLSRKLGQEIQIEDDIRIVVQQLKNGSVRLGIDAPPELTIMRGELLDEIRPQPKGREDNDVHESRTATVD